MNSTLTEADNNQMEKVEKQRIEVEKAQKQLEEQKLPADLVDLVLTDDAEKTHSNIQKLAESVDMLVKARVEELSKTDSPRESAGFKASDNSMNDIASFAQANRLIK
jgi:acetyl-CoA carboxylase alpha subunit